jgi:hypothetical protein
MSDGYVEDMFCKDIFFYLLKENNFYDKEKQEY